MLHRDLKAAKFGVIAIATATLIALAACDQVAMGAIVGRITLDAPSADPNVAGSFDQIYDPTGELTYGASASLQTTFPVYTGSGYESAGWGASGAFFADNGNLKTYASSNGGGFTAFTLAVGHAISTVFWFDRLSYYNAADPTSPPVMPADATLYLNFRLHGVLDAFNTPGPFPYEDPHTSSAGTQVTFGQNNRLPIQFGYATNTDADSSHVVVDTIVTFPVDLTYRYGSPNMWVKEISWQLESRTITSSGAAYSDFYNTMTFDSVTYADGTTPESRGQGISFESGIPSPNLIPEPSTYALAACGILGLAAFRRRRC